jgi:hypothetical protein
LATRKTGITFRCNGILVQGSARNGLEIGLTPKADGLWNVISRLFPTSNDPYLPDDEQLLPNPGKGRFADHPGLGNEVYLMEMV